MRLSTIAAKIAFGTLVLKGAAAHELEENRATLVLRDRTHLSMTLFLAYTDALHQALAPERPIQEFVLVYSAMKSEDLGKELLRAQAKFQASTRIQLAPGGEATISNWRWPGANQVQGLLRQRVMSAMADAGSHAQEAPVEVHADVNAEQPIESVRAQFPTEFRRVLIVAFRPSQVQVEGGALSPALRF